MHSVFAEDQSYSQTEKYEKTLRQKMETLCSLAGKEGFNILPYHEENWLKFRSLPALKQKQIFENYSVFHNICEKTVSGGSRLRNNQQIVWVAIKELGLRPCDNFFDKLDDSDVVEFYGNDCTQIFRNFNFFKVCSYTLAEIYSYDYMELWHRDKTHIEHINQRAVELFTSSNPKTTPWNMSDHLLIEKFSSQKFSIQLRLKYVSPLFDKNKNIAVLASLAGAKLVNQEISDDELMSSATKDELQYDLS